MSSRSTLVSFSLVALVIGALAARATPAAADKPNPKFAGRIMLSDKRYPTSAKSLAAFNAQINKQSKTSFMEDKDKKWKIHFAGFLRSPLNDVEYVIKLYEVSGKAQQLLAAIDQFTTERGQAALISYIVLERKQVGANKEILMTMESNGKVLAASRFKIVGQREQFKGKVDFTEDEANGKPTDDE